MKGTGTNGYQSGGAGTIYLKTASQTYGEVIVDNGGQANGAATDLVSVGTGTVTSAGGVTLTDMNAKWRYGVAGVYVDITRGGASVGRYKVLGASTDGKTLTLESAASGQIQAGDTYQGVEKYDALTVKGNARLTTTDVLEVTNLGSGGAGQSGAIVTPKLTGTTLDINGGTMTVNSPTIFPNVTVRGNATLTTDSLVPLSLTVSGTLTIEAGSTLDASGRGYPQNVTYPGATATGFPHGGSHMGRGGRQGSTTTGLTYGSVYRPQELGAGGDCCRPGGGRVRLVAGTLVVDGSIRANGGDGDSRTGAGGSIWVTAGEVRGGGTIQAQGGVIGGPLGAGGAIAIEYQTSAGAVLQNLNAKGAGSASSNSDNGGAGTVYVKSPASTYGDVVIDNKGTSGQPTELPSLGSGVAQAGTSGATLVTDRSVTIPAYFGGHWIEIRDASSVLKGTWRIGTIADKTVTLEADGSSVPSVAAGDTWQGVYRFDRLDLRSGASLVSLDPIRAALQSPAVSLAPAPGQGLTVGPGATLAFDVSATDAEALSKLALTATGPVATASQRQEFATGAVTSATHRFNVSVLATATTGAEVRLSGEAVDATNATVRSNEIVVTIGADTTAPVISSVTLTPTASGDQYVGGTALSISVSATDDSGRIATLSMTAGGVETVRTGPTGPFTFSHTLPYVAGTTSYDLVFRARDDAGNLTTLTRRLTVLQVQSGPNPPILTWSCPSGATAVPAGATITLQGFATDDNRVLRVDLFRNAETTPFASVPGSSTFVSILQTLALPTTPGPLTIRVVAYDLGLRNAETAFALDVVDAVRIDAANPNWGALATRAGYLDTGTLVVDQPRTIAGLFVLRGATVTHPPFAAGGVGAPLDLNVTGPLWVDCGAKVDASARGYVAGETYPGATPAASGWTGSHIGVGVRPTGVPFNAAVAFGSVVDPREAGGGGPINGGRGGGAISIRSGRAFVDGSITADGEPDADGSGSGGAVSIRADDLAGAGTISASGGSSSSRYGGGGAIAIRVATGAGLPAARVLASGAGGGSVLTKFPGSTFGILRAGASFGGYETVLPSLGSGVALSGSTGTTLVTDRPAAVPAYFTGHRVAVRAADGTLKGLFEISGVENRTLRLVPQAGAPGVEPGDSWEGVHRFDSIASGTIRTDDALWVEAFDGGSFVSLRSGVPTQMRGFVSAASVSAPAVSVLAGASLSAGSITSTGAVRVEAGATVTAVGSSSSIVEGATRTASAAGSHLGVGGGETSATPSYGSVLWPREVGAVGGVAAGGLLPASGGSVLRVIADSLHVAGAIGATGQRIGPDGEFFEAVAGGAGGSIWITTRAVSGNGSVRAEGGGNASSQPSGGGGAISVEYVAEPGSGTWLDSLSAKGGQSTGSSSARGGAGTVVRRGPLGFGSLVVDNGGSSGKQTVLPALGSGLALTGSVGARLVTDRATTIPAYFVGHWVEVRDAASVLKGTWRIISVNDRTVSLEPDAANPPSVVAGDRWQGVYRFDSSVVRNGASLASADPIRLPNVAPVVAISAPAPNAVFRSGQAVPISFTTSDPDGTVVSLRLTLGSSTVTVTNPPANGSTSLNAPSVSSQQTIVLEALATDSTGATATASVPLVIRPDVAPSISATSSPSGSVQSGGTLTISWNASDDVALASVRVDYTGAHFGSETRTVSGTASTGSFTPVSLPAGTTGAINVQVRATDSLGQSTSTSLVLTAVANQAPSVSITSPAANAVVRSGETIPVTFSSSDPDGTVASVRLSLGASSVTVNSPGASATAFLVVPEVAAEETLPLPALATHDTGVTATASVPLVVRPDRPPSISATCGCGTVARPGATFTISYQAGDDAGLTRVVLDATGAVTAHEEIARTGTTATGSFAAIAVPASVTTGTVNVVVSVTDSRGQSAQTTLTLTISDADATPTATASVSSPTVSPSGTIAVTSTLADDRGLRTLRVRVEGSITYDRLVTISSGAPEVTSKTRVVNVPVPRTASGTATVRVTVQDSAGQTATSDPIVVSVADTTAPVIRDLRQISGPTVRADEGIVVAANVFDDGVLERVELSAGSASGVRGDDDPFRPHYEWGFATPDVTQPTDVPIAVVARDLAGNETRVEGTVRVIPNSKPHFWIGMPAEGALARAGGELRVEIRDARDVARVEFFRDAEATPFAQKIAPADLSTFLVIPSDRREGDAVVLRVVAHRANGESFEATRTVRVVEGDVLAPDTVIEASDVSHDDRTIITTGTTIVRGRHRFARIVVSLGSDLRAERSGPAGPEAVEVESTGPVYVSWGSALGGSGLGYRGGLEDWNTSPSGLTLGNVPGSGREAGGSHGGTGQSGVEPAAAPYGSIRNPIHFGGGGGASSSGVKGGAGGGVLHVKAPEIIADGFVSADADGTPENASSGAGAGGSIRLDVPLVRGAGEISALGADPQPVVAPKGTGGGGRIAFLGELTRFLGVGVVRAPGGAQEASRGAAGTMFFQAAGERLGRLRVDGEFAGVGAAKTPLTSIGAGTVGFVNGAVLGNDSASWSPGVEGIEVEVRRGVAFVGRFRVEELLSATRIRLEDDAVGQLKTGDTYQGVQAFDRILVRGNATLTTTDVLEGVVFAWDGGKAEAANGTWLPPSREGQSSARERSLAGAGGPRFLFTPAERRALESFRKSRKETVTHP